MEAIRSFLVLTLIAVCIGGVQAASLTDDLVVYLEMDEGKGDVAKDISGEGNDAELHNPEWVDGVYGKGLKFGGLDIWASIPDDPTLNFADGESFTLAIWTKVTDDLLNKKGSMVSKYQLVGGRQEFYGIFVEEVGYRVQTYCRDAVLVQNLYSKNAINDEEWHHAALVRDAGSKIQLYVDGELEESEVDNTGDLTNPDPLVMGRHYVDLYYNGGIVDELLLWRRALSQAEIQQAMEGDTLTAVDSGQKLSISWGELKSAQ